MGTVNVKVTSAFPYGDSMVEAAEPKGIQALTSSGVSVESTITAGNTDDVIAIETDTDVWAKISDAGTVTAAAGDQHLIAAGTTRYFTKQPLNAKVAVVDK